MDSNIFLSQPANIAILPVSARWHPPETGQSTANPDFADINLPILTTSAVPRSSKVTSSNDNPTSSNV